MRIESSYITSGLIGQGPYGKTEIHRTTVDQQGHVYHTIEKHPFLSYSAQGKIEQIEQLGQTIDKRV
jgi:hypothetical protein